MGKDRISEFPEELLLHIVTTSYKNCYNHKCFVETMAVSLEDGAETQLRI